MSNDDEIRKAADKLRETGYASWTRSPRRAEWVEVVILPICENCGHPKYCHNWTAKVRALADPPVCSKFTRTPLWRRLLRKS